MNAPAERFVGRGGLKLEHALKEFNLNPLGLTCADFGCNVGGFTDCLLQQGASKVYAVDTGYGALAWKLRNDPRVCVMERTNALHASAPQLVDLIAIDLAWTPQRHAIPAALRWLKPGGCIVSLVKPHYETGNRSSLKHGVLAEADAARIVDDVSRSLPSLGVEVLGVTRSPILGGATKKNKQGNAEWLVQLRPQAPASSPRPSPPTGAA